MSCADASKHRKAIILGLASFLSRVCLVLMHFLPLSETFGLEMLRAVLKVYNAMLRQRVETREQAASSVANMALEPDYSRHIFHYVIDGFICIELCEVLIVLISFQKVNNIQSPQSSKTKREAIL